jgi:hypothetical protein
MRLVTFAFAFALIALTTSASAATTYPVCWKGNAGCKHSLTSSWELTTFNGSVTASRTRDATLTCADAASGPKEEVVSGRYAVSFTLNPQSSKQIIRSDAAGRPRTPFALNLRFNVARLTHEKIRTVTPKGDGTCTESTRDCDKTGTPLTKPDKLTVATTKRTVNQRMAGDFIESVTVPCAPDSATVKTVLPSTGPMFGTYLDEATGLRNFQHKTTVVVAGRTDMPGNGEVTSEVRARLSYERIRRACSYYSKSQKRCRTTRS